MVGLAATARRYKPALMDLFAVIADPTRRIMIEMMRNDELPAGSFVAAFPGVTQPAISQHLKVLRDAGIATVRSDRQRRLYSLTPNALGPLHEWLGAAGQKRETEPDPVPVAPKPQRAKPKPAPEPAPMLDLFG